MGGARSSARARQCVADNNYVQQSINTIWNKAPCSCAGDRGQVCSSTAGHHVVSLVIRQHAPFAYISSDTILFLTLLSHKKQQQQ